MADPKSIFARALSAFKARTLYSNIINDRSAVYYTTCIAATDPFTDMSKVDVNYLPGYSPVIVDAADPVSLREPEPPKPARPLAVTAWPLLSSLLTRARMALLLSVFLPIGGAVFLLNAAVQSVRSSQRIRMHAAGKGGLAPDQYRLPLMVERARRTAEELFERVNASQEEEFLPDDGGDEAAEPLLRDPAKMDGAGGDDAKARQGPLLALSQAQFDMVRNLDELGWNKFPVHIKEVMHTHAAIIVRTERESFREGRVVVGHWLDHLKI
jgi:hypothetical protein